MMNCLQTTCRRAQLFSVFTATPKRFYSVTLPPPSKWRAIFRSNKLTNSRITLSDPEAARQIAEAFVPDGVKDQTIIEAFPGPGQLTRALLNLPRERIKKLIVLEEVPEYLKYLKPLEKLDDRIVVFSHSGLFWATYDKLHAAGHFKDVQTHPWETLHPQLRYISHVQSNVYGDQLVSQILRFIPEKGWLFKYGRIPLQFVLSHGLYRRMAATVTEGVAARCKLSLITQALSTCTSPVPYEATQPFEAHFHPAPPAYQKQTKRALKGTAPFQTAVVIPRADAQDVIPPHLMDKWDYCLRRLFVLRIQPISKALGLLGPNGETLAKKLHDPSLPPEERADPSTPVRCLDVRDWKLIVKAFDEWPFAPQDLGVRDNLREDN